MNHTSAVQSAIRAPQSKVRVQRSAVATPKSEFGNPHAPLRIPQSVYRFPLPTNPHSAVSPRLLAATALVALPPLLVLLHSPFGQDPAYHAFADQRGWYGIRNTLDVLTNLRPPEPWRNQGEPTWR